MTKRLVTVRQGRGNRVHLAVVYSDRLGGDLGTPICSSTTGNPWVSPTYYVDAPVTCRRCIKARQSWYERGVTQ